VDNKSISLAELQSLLNPQNIKLKLLAEERVAIPKEDV
jgi:hypothetical protein